MKKLDMTKPYGTIHGDLSGPRYEQNNCLFDREGNEWPSTSDAPATLVATVTVPVTAEPEKPKKKVEEDQVAKQLI